MTTDMIQLDTQSYASIAAAKQEPAWLQQSRAEAIALAAKLPLPALTKTRIDRWTLGGTGEYRPSPAVQDAADLPGHVAELIGEHANVLVQVDSGVVYSRLSPELQRQGVILMSLEQAAAEHMELVQSYLFKAVKPDENRLTALHAALWNGGLFLYVPANVEVSEPIQAVFYSASEQATFAPHVLIVAEANSSVTYVDNYLSAVHGVDTLHTGMMEVFAKGGSRVRAATVHDLDAHMTDISYRRAVAENDAKVDWVIGELSYGNAVTETYTILKGNGSQSDMKVISVGTGAQKVNYTTRAVHFGRASASNMITRAVMRDEATAIVDGITKIEHGASKSDGQQTERMLMLSPKARGDANPILLIDEDDVTAGHAASVGQVSPEQIYYLMSRGIPREEAERLIIYGFLSPVIEEIPLETLRERLSALVERKIGR